MAISTSSRPSRPVGAFRTPWFQALESPRLCIIPVRDRNGLVQAFSLIADREVARLMEFPPELSFRQFEQGFHRGPRKDIFLLQERASGRLAGLVIFCALPGRTSWHSILYGLHPDFRGHGLAKEGCRTLVACMARNRISEGITATVKGSNRPSQKVVEALGLRLVPGAGQSEWAMPMEGFRPTIPERLWRLPRWDQVPTGIARLARRVMGVLV